MPAVFAAAQVVVPSWHAMRQAWKSMTVLRDSLGPSPCCSGASTLKWPHLTPPHPAGTAPSQRVPVVVTIDAITCTPHVSWPAGHWTLADSPVAVEVDQLENRCQRYSTEKEKYASGGHGFFVRSPVADAGGETQGQDLAEVKARADAAGDGDVDTPGKRQRTGSPLHGLRETYWLKVMLLPRLQVSVSSDVHR